MSVYSLIAAKEYHEQVLFFDWLRFTQPIIYTMAFHVPNGEYRYKSTGKKLKAAGVKPGVPDVFIMVPNKQYYGLIIEFKKKSLKINKKTGLLEKKPANVSIYQKQWIKNLNDFGYLAVICQGFDEAKKTVENYLQ